MTLTTDAILCGADFFSVHHHDGRFLRLPGVFAFSRHTPDGARTILYVGQAASINEAAHATSSTWSVALSAGMNELLVCVAVKDSTDRRRLAAAIVEAHRPPLNPAGAIHSVFLVPKPAKAACA